MSPNTIFIDGRWREARSGATFFVHDPATLEVIADVADGGIEEAGEAADAAFLAQARWADTLPERRANLLRKLANLLLRERRRLAQLLVRESGKPCPEALAEVDSSAACLKWYAEEALRCYGHRIPGFREEIRMWTSQAPVGVVCVITPWNYPLATLFRKLAPALAAGCAVVLKPAPQTPLSAVEVMLLMEEVEFPPGVANLVTTNHAEEVVTVWLEDLRIRKIAFTGSTAVGKRLYSRAAGTMKKLTLELGGTAPAIVCADAHLESSAEAIVASRFRHAGQTCICVQSVYADHRIFEPFLHRLQTRIRGLRVGNGTDPGVNCGPLVNQESLERVTRFVDDAVAKGAELCAGGKRLVLKDPNRGFFFEPTLLARASQDMKIVEEEVFGPVLAVSCFSTLEEVIDRANASRFGLVAYLFTQDLNRAFRLAEALETGTVGINTTQVVAPQLPFGGLKESGIGKENGREGIEEYLVTRSTVVRLAEAGVE